MNRLVKLLLLAILLLSGLSACKITSAVEGQDKSVRVCKNTTKLVLETYNELKIPDHFRSDHPEKKEGDFDLAAFVNSFDYLKINEGFQVDYVYTYRNAMGHPLLYTIPIAKPRFDTEDEFKKGKPSPFTYGIESTDLRWGFLQLAILEELGGNFYQYFTAEYDDALIICDVDDIENLIDQLGSSEIQSPMNWWQKMRALTISETDPLVLVDKDSNKVDVSMLVFVNNDGIIRRTYSYSYLFPHELLNVSDEVIVEYHSEPKQTTKR